VNNVNDREEDMETKMSIDTIQFSRREALKTGLRAGTALGVAGLAGFTVLGGAGGGAQPLG
jgi:hypothetical protein